MSAIQSLQQLDAAHICLPSVYPGIKTEKTWEHPLLHYTKLQNLTSLSVIGPMIMVHTAYAVVEAR